MTYATEILAFEQRFSERGLHISVALIQYGVAYATEISAPLAMFLRDIDANTINSRIFNRVQDAESGQSANLDRWKTRVIDNRYEHSRCQATSLCAICYRRDKFLI